MGAKSSMSGRLRWPWTGTATAGRPRTPSRCCGARGVALVPHARCVRLETCGKRVAAVHGVWRGRPFICRPQVVVVAVGAEHVLTLVGDVLPQGTEVLP